MDPYIYVGLAFLVAGYTANIWQGLGPAVDTSLPHSIILFSHSEVNLLRPV